MAQYALWAIKAMRDEPFPLFAAAANRKREVVAEQQEPDVALRQMSALGHRESHGAEMSASADEPHSGDVIESRRRGACA